MRIITHNPKPVYNPCHIALCKAIRIEGKPAVCGAVVVQPCSGKEIKPMNAKKTIGTLLLLAGIVVLILSVIANKIGIGSFSGYGLTQISCIILGAVIALIGLVLMRRK
jgi:hypothetical protein